MSGLRLAATFFLHGYRWLISRKSAAHFETSDSMLDICVAEFDTNDSRLDIVDSKLKICVAIVNGMTLFF